MNQVQTAQAVAPRLEKLNHSCEAMEAHFMKDLLQEMQKTVTETKDGEDFGEDTYKDMFNEAVSQAITKKAGLGIAKTLYNSLAPRAVREELANQRSRNAANKLAATSGENK